MSENIDDLLKTLRIATQNLNTQQNIVRDLKLKVNLIKKEDLDAQYAGIMYKSENRYYKILEFNPYDIDYAYCLIFAYDKSDKNKCSLPKVEPVHLILYNYNLSEETTDFINRVEISQEEWLTAYNEVCNLGAHIKTLHDAENISMY